EQNHPAVGGRTGDPEDQAGVRDQSVVHAEDGRPQTGAAAPGMVATPDLGHRGWHRMALFRRWRMGAHAAVLYVHAPPLHRGKHPPQRASAESSDELRDNASTRARSVIESGFSAGV